MEGNYIGFDPKKITINWNYCNALSTLSKCKHGRAAAILLDEDFSQVYSIGINGGPSHGEDCVCSKESPKYGCAHAEQNCLVKNSDYIKPKIMMCTKACCPTCATLIVNSKANIKHFIYKEEFSSNKGLIILQNAGILVYKL